MERCVQCTTESFNFWIVPLKTCYMVVISSLTLVVASPLTVKITPLAFRERVSDRVVSIMYLK